MLKTMEAFILACKISGVVKIIKAMIMHLSNTGVQFSIEKYFWVVFDKLKKSTSDFQGFRVFDVFCPERVHGEPMVATVKRGVSQI